MEEPTAEVLPSFLTRDPNATPLMLDPADLTTSTHEAHPTIGVPRRGLSDDEVRSLTERFDLVTWPEREPVRTHARYLDEAGPNGVYSRVVLEPAAPLEERWYALRATFDESDAPSEDVNPRDGRFVVSRFHLGTHPILRRVHVSAREDGGGDIVLHFSEAVTVDANPFGVRVNGEETTCRLANPLALRAGGETRVWLDCPTLPGGSTISIDERHPTYASSGELVRAANGDDLVEVAVIDDVVRRPAEPRHDVLFIDEPEGRPEGTPRSSTFVPEFGLTGRSRP